jgi:hypothetical protein
VDEKFSANKSPPFRKVIFVGRHVPVCARKLGAGGLARWGNAHRVSGFHWNEVLLCASGQMTLVRKPCCDIDLLQT